MTRRRGFWLWGYIAAIALAGAVVHVYAVLPLASGADRHSPLWLAVVVVGFVLSERFVVHVRVGTEALSYSMSEIPLVLGLFFVRPDLLILCRLVGGGLAFVWQRKAFRKNAFNAALFVLETSTAVAVWHLVLGGAEPLSPRGWLATGIVVVCISTLGSTLVSGAIAITTGERPGPATSAFGLGQVADLANASFALVGVYLLEADWRTVWMLGVVVAVLVVAYRSYEGARARSESLEQVNRFTELVGREIEVDAVVRSVLAEVRAAFEVGSVQLRLSRPPEPDQDWVLVQGNGETTSTVECRHSALLDQLAVHAVEGSLLVSRTTRSAHLAALVRREGVRDCLMVPLRSEGHVIGSIVVADRLSDVATYTPAEVGQLRALANHAAVVIDSALRAQLIIRQAEEREHLALHDELTGLANRRLLADRLAEVLDEGGASVLVLDLDRFKDVNDTLGHEIGDRLLRLVADRLEGAVRADALVARVGGDEFAVLIPGADDLGARACAGSVQDALSRPFDLDGITVAAEVSMGVAVPEPDTDATTMLRWADLAMFAAKTNRTGLEVYRPELDRQDATRLGLLADLREAVASDGLAVHYQLKVDVHTGAIEGVEALARWQHPEHGPIGPDEFIPLAEHSSLITPLTMVVLRRALRDCTRWRSARPTFSVSVNISPRSLLDPTFVEAVARELAMAELGADALILEITETSLMADPDRAVAALQRLRDLGIRLSVDDLGTGYSSLAYLQRLPVCEVKVDRTFIASFPDESSLAVVGAIVDLGHRLGHRVVAEGVETAAAFEHLAVLGCDAAQGFWLARPVPATELTAMLEVWQPPRGDGLLRVI